MLDDDSWQRVPILYEDPLYCLPSLPSQILPNAPTHPHSFCCFFALDECVDLNFSSIGTVIPAAHSCCVLYATEHQIY